MSEALFALVSGSYVYTFLSTRNAAKKADIDKLQDRVDKIYEILLELKKNGNGGCK